MNLFIESGVKEGIKNLASLKLYEYKLYAARTGLRSTELVN